MAAEDGGDGPFDEAVVNYEGDDDADGGVDEAFEGDGDGGFVVGVGFAGNGGVEVAEEYEGAFPE